MSFVLVRRQCFDCNGGGFADEVGAWIKDITKKMEGCEIKSIRPMDRSSTKSGFGSRALALVSLSVLSDTIFSALNINVQMFFFTLSKPATSILFWTKLATTTGSHPSPSFRWVSTPTKGDTALEGVDTYQSRYHLGRCQHLAKDISQWQVSTNFAHTRKTTHSS